MEDAAENETCAAAAQIVFQPPGVPNAMTKTTTQAPCPHCGAAPTAPPFENQPAATEDASAQNASRHGELEREYDHRGVLLPRRARVGGIITPQ